jgi:hypothetical protein
VQQGKTYLQPTMYFYSQENAGAVVALQFVSSEVHIKAFYALEEVSNLLYFIYSRAV